MDLSPGQRRRFVLAFYDRGTRPIQTFDNEAGLVTEPNAISELVDRYVAAGTIRMMGEGEGRHIVGKDTASITRFGKEVDEIFDKLKFRKHPGTTLFGAMPRSDYAQALLEHQALFDPESGHVVALDENSLAAAFDELELVDRECRIDNLGLARIPRGLITANNGILKEYRDESIGYGRERRPGPIQKIVARFPSAAATVPVFEALQELDKQITPEVREKMLQRLTDHPEIRARVLPGISLEELADSIPTTYAEFKGLVNQVVEIQNRAQEAGAEALITAPGESRLRDNRERPSSWDATTRAPRRDDNSVEADRMRVMRRIEADQRRNPEDWGREIDLARRLRIASPEQIRRAEQQANTFARILTGTNASAVTRAFRVLTPEERIEALTLADETRRERLLSTLPQDQQETYVRALSGEAVGLPAAPPPSAKQTIDPTAVYRIRTDQDPLVRTAAFLGLPPAARLEALKAVPESTRAELLKALPRDLQRSLSTEITTYFQERNRSTPASAIDQATFAAILNEPNAEARAAAFGSLGTWDRLDALKVASEDLRAELIGSLSPVTASVFSKRLKEWEDYQQSRVATPLTIGAPAPAPERNRRVGFSTQETNFEAIKAILDSEPPNSTSKVRRFCQESLDNQRIAYPLLSVNERMLMREMMVEAFAREQQRLAELRGERVIVDGDTQENDGLSSSELDVDTAIEGSLADLLANSSITLDDSDFLDEDLDVETVQDRNLVRGLPTNNGQLDPAKVVDNAMTERFAGAHVPTNRQSFTLHEFSTDDHLVLVDERTKAYSVIPVDGIRASCLGITALKNDDWQEGLFSEKEQPEKIVRAIVKAGSPITITPAVENVAGREVATGFKLYAVIPRTFSDNRREAEKKALNNLAEADVRRMFGEFHEIDEQAVLAEAQRMVTGGNGIGASAFTQRDVSRATEAARREAADIAAGTAPNAFGNAGDGVTTVTHNHLIVNHLKEDKSGYTFDEPIHYQGTILSVGAHYSAILHDSGAIYSHKNAALSSLAENLVPGAMVDVTYKGSDNREEAEVVLQGMDPRVQALAAREHQALTQDMLQHRIAEYAQQIELTPRDPGRVAPKMMDYNHEQIHRLTGEAISVDEYLTFLYNEEENAIYPLPTQALGLQLKQGEMAAVSAGPLGYNLIDHAMGADAKKMLDRQALLEGITDARERAFDRIELRELAQALNVSTDQLRPAADLAGDVERGSAVGAVQHRYSSNRNLYLTSDPSQDVIYYHPVSLWTDKGMRSKQSWDIEIGNVATMSVSRNGFVKIEPLLPYEREEYKLAPKYEWALNDKFQPAARSRTELATRSEIARGALSDAITVPYERVGDANVRPVDMEQAIFDRYTEEMPDFDVDKAVLATVTALNPRAIALESISSAKNGVSHLIVIGTDEIPKEEIETLHSGDLVKLSINNDGVHINSVLAPGLLDQLRVAQSEATRSDEREQAAERAQAGEHMHDASIDDELADVLGRDDLDYATVASAHASDFDHGYDDIELDAVDLQQAAEQERHHEMSADGMSR